MVGETRLEIDAAGVPKGSVQLGIHSDIVPKKKQKGKNATQKPSSEIDNTG